MESPRSQITLTGHNQPAQLTDGGGMGRTARRTGLSQSAANPYRAGCRERLCPLPAPCRLPAPRRCGSQRGKMNAGLASLGGPARQFAVLPWGRDEPRRERIPGMCADKRHISVRLALAHLRHFRIKGDLVDGGFKLPPAPGRGACPCARARSRARRAQTVVSPSIRSLTSALLVSPARAESRPRPAAPRTSGAEFLMQVAP